MTPNSVIFFKLIYCNNNLKQLNQLKLSFSFIEVLWFCTVTLQLLLELHWVISDCEARYYLGQINFVPMFAFISVLSSLRRHLSQETRNLLNKWELWNKAGWLKLMLHIKHTRWWTSMCKTSTVTHGTSSVFWCWRNSYSTLRAISPQNLVARTLRTHSLPF